MTKQDRLDLINQRLSELDEINRKIDEILELLEPKNTIPNISFSKANENVSMKEMYDYEIGLYKRLDNKK